MERRNEELFQQTFSMSITAARAVRPYVDTDHLTSMTERTNDLDVN